MIKTVIIACEKDGQNYSVSGFITVDDISSLKVLWHINNLIENSEDNSYTAKKDALYFTNVDFNRLCSYITEISAWRYYDKVSFKVNDSIAYADEIESIAKSVYKF